MLADARVLSLARREADIAVRLGRPEDSDLVGSHVADIDYAYFCSPDVAERALAGDRLAFVDYELRQRRAAKPGGSPNIAPGRASRCAATTSCCKPTPFAAASASGLLPKYLARDLVRLPWAPTPPKREIWLMTRRDLADVPRIRLLLDALARWFRADREIF